MELILIYLEATNLYLFANDRSSVIETLTIVDTKSTRMYFVKLFTFFTKTISLVLLV